MMLVKTVINSPSIGGGNVELPGHLRMRWWAFVRDEISVHEEPYPPILIAQF